MASDNDNFLPIHFVFDELEDTDGVHQCTPSMCTPSMTGFGAPHQYPLEWAASYRSHCMLTCDIPTAHRIP